MIKLENSLPQSVYEKKKTRRAIGMTTTGFPSSQMNILNKYPAIIIRSKKIIPTIGLYQVLTRSLRPIFKMCQSRLYRVRIGSPTLRCPQYWLYLPKVLTLWRRHKKKKGFKFITISTLVKGMGQDTKKWQSALAQACSPTSTLQGKLRRTTTMGTVRMSKEGERYQSQGHTSLTFGWKVLSMLPMIYKNISGLRLNTHRHRWPNTLSREFTPGF